MNKHIGHEDGYNYDYFDEYRTKDIEIASSLIAVNFELISIEKGKGRELWFVFHNTEELADVVESFWDHSMQLSPLLFSTTRRNLKNRIFALNSKR